MDQRRRIVQEPTSSTSIIIIDNIANISAFCQSDGLLLTSTANDVAMAELTDVVSQLAVSVDNIEAAMAPLLQRPLADTMASLAGPVERATLLFWLAFTIHSCARGWPPCLLSKTHEVDIMLAVHAKLQAADPEETGVMDEVVSQAYPPCATQLICANRIA